MESDTEGMILKRLLVLEGAVEEVHKEATAARQEASAARASSEKANEALNGRLRTIELWRARIEGAWSGAKFGWTLAGAAFGGIGTALAMRALGG